MNRLTPITDGSDESANVVTVGLEMQKDKSSMSSDEALVTPRVRQYCEQFSPC